MITSLPTSELCNYVARQVSNLFPDRVLSGEALTSFVSRALERTEHCFSRINIKYFFDGNQTRFNHLHTDQYAMFLYYLCNSIHRMGGDSSLAAKVYALNKALHALDAFYEVELPEVFCVQHPVGTVLGRGHYSNYFFVYQRCSIGANLQNEYPHLGEGIVMFGGSTIIGGGTVGANTWLSVGATVMDADIPANSIVFGRKPAQVIKPAKRNVVKDLFRVR